MANQQPDDLQAQLEAERQRNRELQEQLTKACVEAEDLRRQLETWKPIAESWIREHMGTKEECERDLREMLAHPEELLDMEVVLRDLEKDFGEPDSGEHAA